MSILDSDSKNEPAVVSSQGAYMHALQFGGVNSSSCDQFSFRGSYYADDFFNRYSAYLRHTNGPQMCRTGNGTWCLKQNDGGLASSASMATWFLADGRSCNASWWPVKEPKSVTAKERGAFTKLPTQIRGPSKSF